MDEEDHVTPRTHDAWNDASPLAAVYDLPAPRILSEGPVRFLLVSGALDNDRWGLIGAFWLAIDGANGGFLVSPDSIWSGGELARCYRGALARAWNHDAIYTYWQRQVGSAGDVMIDPQQHADALFQVARRVGAI